MMLMAISLYSMVILTGSWDVVVRLTRDNGIAVSTLVAVVAGIFLLSL